MTVLATILATVTVVFPREGQLLPAVSQCYAIGSVDDGRRTLEIQGRQVEVAAGGGWVTMLEVRPGENRVPVDGQLLTFTAEAPKSPVAALAEKLPKVYTKLEYAADVPKLHPAGRPAAAVTIVLDAGHGGDDLGTQGPHATPEKTLNLLMVEAVAEILRERGFKVVLTRDRDVAVPLYDRPKAAHAVGADAFVSIHHNAPPCDRDPRQFRYHMVYAWNDIGKALATPINRRMAAAFGKTLKNNGVGHANYAVTRNPEIPSCLIEIDFMTTPQGEEDCCDSSRRRQVAAAIAAGIIDWTQGKQ